MINDASVLFLHARLSGYFVACLKRLRAAGVNVTVIAQPPSSSAPFDGLDAQGIDVRYVDESVPFKHVEPLPSAVVIGNWWNRGYLRIGRELRRQGVPVIFTCDQPWLGTWNQRVKLAMVRARITRVASHIWIPGEPHLRVARCLGFDPNHIIDGLYACDVDHFGAHGTSFESREKSFVFVGRLEEIKGVRSLLQAYEAYRLKASNPWKLRLIGAGSLRDELDGRENVEHIPFIQPEDLPSQLGRNSAFVMPSLHEPWGVAIHEAAAVGLPMICSDRCAAASHFVEPNQNGLIFRAGDVGSLQNSLERIASLEVPVLTSWGNKSRELAFEFTPALWAQRLLSVCGGRRNLREDSWDGARAGVVVRHSKTALGRGVVA